MQPEAVLRGRDPRDGVYVTGLPIWASQLNGAYYKVEGKNGIEYHLTSYNYYGLRIKHARIYRRNDERWTLEVMDSIPLFTSKTNELFGDWNLIFVSNISNICTWFQSKYDLIYTGGLIIGLILSSALMGSILTIKYLIK
jgi:hypothetical protein